MKRIALSLCLAVSLAGCGVPGFVAGVPTAPVVIADQSKIDEQVGLTVTLAYTAAARAAALVIETGLVKDKAAIARIGQLNARAYAAVVGVRSAYKAGNASGYASALTQAREAVAALLGAAKGN